MIHVSKSKFTVERMIYIKWNSSNEKVKEFITKNQTTEVQSFARQSKSDKDSTKVLGMQWDEKDDKLAIDLESNTSDIRVERIVTKRSMLSRVSEIFDSLGVATIVDKSPWDT